MAAAGGSACAMNAPASDGELSCRVTGEASLPAESGGAAALCAAIEEAVAVRLPHAGASIEVRVLSPFALAATVTMADGRTLPEQKFASNDRALTEGSFRRFAEALATALAAGR